MTANPKYGHAFALWRGASETYAGDENCSQGGKLIDCALVSRLDSDYISSPRWADLCHKFDTATRLEVGFWNIGLRGA